jgi:uncharacterized protein (DUF58 family)
MPEPLVTLKDLRQFDNLEFLAKQVVEGFITGMHKSPFHGFSVEFAEHRLYNTGDPVKDIDWKVYARTNKLFVKKYEEETNLRCQIVVDASSSMYYPFDENEKRKSVNKINFSAVSSAALMHLMKKQRDAVGLTIFTNEIQEHLRARSTTVHHRLLTSHLENLINQKPKHKQTGAARSLHQLAESIPRRSLVILFSDMFENMSLSEEGQQEMESVFAALQHLKYNKHEVILFHVVDKDKELDFGFDNRPYIFEDVETGEKVRLQSNQIKEQYVKQMQEFERELKLRCGQYKIDFVEADINQHFAQVLMPYLTKRTKML